MAGTIIPHNAVVDTWIQTIRGQRVILDADLAKIYGVATKRLNEQYVDNQQDDGNRSQFATGSSKHRDPRFAPFAFTEHGAIMAATVLNSPQAIQMSVFVVRAFVRIRQMLSIPHDLARELATLEKKLTARLDGHDIAITEVLQQIMLLLNPPPEPGPPRKELGFHVRERRASYHVGRRNGVKGWPVPEKIITPSSPSIASPCRRP